MPRLNPAFLTLPAPSRLGTSLPTPLPLWSPPRLNFEKRITIRTDPGVPTSSSLFQRLGRLLLRPRLIIIFVLVSFVIVITMLLPVRPVSYPGVINLPLDKGNGGSKGEGQREKPVTAPAAGDFPETILHSGLESLSERPSPFSDRTHLIIVACHAIWKGGPQLGEVDEEWTLEPYQIGYNETLIWISHIERGIQQLRRDARNHHKPLLMFSGGETRPSAGPLSESASYFALANTRGLVTESILPYVTTEIFSRDSLENLLFSICRFKEYTGRYPEHISIISYEFKRRRFEDLHRRAARWPLERFTFIGIDAPSSEETEVPISNVSGVDNAKKKIQEHRKTMKEFELSNSLVPFENDLYGCRNESLREKKESRAWSRRAGSEEYEGTCPEMKGLLTWCSAAENGTQLYPDPLPWAP